MELWSEEVPKGTHQSPTRPGGAPYPLGHATLSCGVVVARLPMPLAINSEMPYKNDIKFLGLFAAVCEAEP
jgi:hypothetical protein